MEAKLLSEICADTGVSRRAIQGYEKAGLVTASGKNKYGYLLYDHEAEERISRIRFFQEIGFTIREIAAFIDASNEMPKKVLCIKAQEMQKDLKYRRDLLDKVNEMIEAL